MTSREAYDVAIVGGGVIGMSTAWQAADRGQRIALIDPEPAGGASRAAAGMLAPVTELHYGEEALLELNLAAARRYPSFVAELEDRTGIDVGYRTCGTLAVALDGGDRAVLDDLYEFQRSLGLTVDRLSGKDCRQLEPMLTPGVCGGLLVAGDHQVDNRRLLKALGAALRITGVDVVKQRVASILVEGGRAAGVAVEGGSSIRAATTVLAAGCRTGEIAGLPPSLVPTVRPVKGQILRLSVPPAYQPLLSRSVRGTVRGFPVYLVPRDDGELVVGATVEELGFDEQVTAGGVYALLRDAVAIVPSLTELPLMETTARLRPGSPDNAPLVGGTDLPGLVIASGHYRNGILLAPVTADAVADIVTGGSAPDWVASFAPQRFDAAVAAR